MCWLLSIYIHCLEPANSEHLNLGLSHGVLEASAPSQLLLTPWWLKKLHLGTHHCCLWLQSLEDTRNPDFHPEMYNHYCLHGTIWLTAFWLLWPAYADIWGLFWGHLDHVILAEWNSSWFSGADTQVFVWFPPLEILLSLSFCAVISSSAQRLLSWQQQL